MRLAPTLKLIVVLAVLATLAVGTVALAKGKPIRPCSKNIFCLDVWDPVICDDGKIYSNDCYARRACATGCVPYGDGGPVPF